MVLVHAPFLPTPDSKPPSKTDKNTQALQNFRDMTAYADKCVGRIVDALEKNVHEHLNKMGFVWK